jgi:hypothetical protein
MRRALVLSAGALLAAVALLGGSALAGQTSSDLSDTGQVGASAAARSSAALDAASFGNLGLTVLVDESYCATGGVQCSGSGHTGAAAGPTNHNPVRLGIQVLRGGTPLNGLSSGRFTTSNTFVPAGGPSVARVVCASCFQAGANGVYTIFVHPAPAVNWKSGSYFVQVRVNLGTTQLRALVEIEIPF